MKKFLILFILAPAILWATETIKKGQTYVAQEDVLVFTLKEMNALKAKIESGDKAELLVAEYSSLVSEFKKLKDFQAETIGQFKELDRMKQESIKIYREAIGSYKEIIETLQKNNGSLQANLNSTRRQTRFQRYLNFVLGFAAPVLGARALGAIK